MKEMRSLNQKQTATPDLQVTLDQGARVHPTENQPGNLHRKSEDTMFFWGEDTNWPACLV